MRAVSKVTLYVGAAVVGLVGCASESSTPTSVQAPGSALLALGVTNNTPVVGQVKVCKTGNVNGTFALSIAPANGSVGGSLASSPLTIATGTCQVVAEDQTAVNGTGSNVTVDETSAGFVDGTVVFVSATAGVSAPTTLTDGSTYFVNAFHGYVLTYNNQVTEPPPACDFITFGRLVTTAPNGDKVVISGNAGGNAPGGGFLGHVNVQVGGVEYNLSDIATYGAISSGALAGKTNSRMVTGTAKGGATIELRLWDGGEPGKNTDYVALKINGVDILNAAGQTIDQGNMQYHNVCRGPADVE